MRTHDEAQEEPCDDEARAPLRAPTMGDLSKKAAASSSSSDAAASALILGFNFVSTVVLINLNKWVRARAAGEPARLDAP